MNASPAARRAVSPTRCTRFCNKSLRNGGNEPRYRRCGRYGEFRATTASCRRRASRRLAFDAAVTMSREPGYYCRQENEMKLGVMSFNTEYSIRADDLAVACEERGFESVWFPEHTHIPASRETPCIPQGLQCRCGGPERAPASGWTHAGFRPDLHVRRIRNLRG